jgi:uncharacterized protein with NAD-binding domain and iron-sulfur cluster
LDHAKTRILAIGGGVGTISAIYALTRLPNWQEKFDITVYQMGWRLGGKGASGRNGAKGQRIEEHGLHVWAGFYQNAFRSLRDCYGELARLGLRAPGAPLATIEQAFKPLNHLFLAEDVPRPDGMGVDWRPWLIDLPSNAEVPGSATTAPTPFETFRKTLAILMEFIERDELESATPSVGPRPVRPHPTPKLHAAHRRLHGYAKSLHSNPRLHLPSHQSMLADLLHAAQAEVRAHLTPAALQDDGLRRKLMLMDVALAYAHGLAASDAFTTGYDALDQWEFTDWLRANGASDIALKSVLMRGCYDFVFGFPAGHFHHRDVGAGTAARAMGRLILNYSGAIFFKMQAGMGDTIFAPYYQVLERIGVKFRFFNAARALRLSADGSEIAAVDMLRQADVAHGAYSPLTPVKGLPCWPSEPLWGQLVDGTRLQADGVDFESEKFGPTGTAYTLELGRDFDKVLLGASLGSLPRLTADLAAASPRWAHMLRSIKTVGTAAAQFWLDKSASELGWDEVVAQHNNAAAIPKGALRTVLTGFAEPLDTWADMSHLIAVEDWPAPGPASIAYFCSPTPDGDSLDAFKARTRLWMEQELPTLWPKGGALPFHGGGFDDQYFRVNLFGSERYVLSVTGSVAHRLAPDESGFSNLVLAGDWTRCGLNAGCVEAATMSGIAAASALSGVDLPNVGAEDIPEEQSLIEAAAFQSLSVTAADWPLTGLFARGEMTGWFLFYAMPRAEVAKLLPKGVHLGHSDMVPAGMHPVGLSFCRFHKVRSSFLPGFLAMPPYDEATFAIPDTRTDEGGPAPLLYPRHLYVDSPAAILAGKLFYAMNKSRAKMVMGNSTFTGENAQGLRMNAQFNQIGDPVPLTAHPAIGAVARVLGTAFVTDHPVLGLQYNAFDLHLDKAYVAPVNGRVQISDPGPGGFPAVDLRAGPLLPQAVPGLPGAMRLWCSWSLTNPVDGTRIRRVAKARSFMGDLAT